MLFDRKDYAGILRRFVILLVDLPILLVGASFVSVVYDEVFAPSSPTALRCTGYTVAGFLFSYLVLLKMFLGTPGYWVAGVRILNLRGARPSLLRMTFRLLLWVFGPFNVIVDFLWLGGDPARQTLRDKFAETIVVSRKAEPIGEGVLNLKRYQFMGMSMVFYEVERTESSTRTAT